jgi:hypothetical protein
MIYLKDSLDKKYEIKSEFDKVIGNTENAFNKVKFNFNNSFSAC